MEKKKKKKKEKEKKLKVEEGKLKFDLQIRFCKAARLFLHSAGNS